MFLGWSQIFSVRIGDVDVELKVFIVRRLFNAFLFFFVSVGQRVVLQNSQLASARCFVVVGFHVELRQLFSSETLIFLRGHSFVGSSRLEERQISRPER